MAAPEEDIGLATKASRFLLNKIIDHPIYATAAGIGTYLAYRHQKKKDVKEKELVANTNPKFEKKVDYLTGRPKSKYDVGNI